MCTPPDPGNQKAPGNVAAGGFNGGDDGNRTHDPLLAKQIIQTRIPPAYSPYAGMIPILSVTLLASVDRCLPSLLARQWHGRYVPG